ncbi:cupin domain-containing protein [Streptomyces hirsutus]
MAGPNGSTFGVSSFPAHSSGEVGANDLGDSMTVTDDDGDAGMHASDTIDYEVVIGKVDLVLPGGKKRTLVPGDLLVMAGVPHAGRTLTTRTACTSS